VKEHNEGTLLDENGHPKEQLLGIIAGKAGTGKSKLIRAMKSYLGNQLVLGSYTGKASKNIDGRTLHDLLGLNIASWE